MTDEVMNGGIEAALDAWWAADPGPTDTSYREAMGAAIRASRSATPAQTKGDDLVGRLTVFAQITPDHPGGGSFLNAAAVDLVEQAASRIQSLTASNEAARKRAAFHAGAADDAETAIQAAQAEIARMREALENEKMWHEDQDKSLSKQPPSSGPNGNQWQRMMHREHIDLLTAALTPQEPT